jgi:hypothetical protein
MKPSFKNKHLISCLHDDFIDCYRDHLHRIEPASELVDHAHRLRDALNELCAELHATPPLPHVDSGDALPPSRGQ